MSTLFSQICCIKWAFFNILDRALDGIHRDVDAQAHILCGHKVAPLTTDEESISLYDVYIAPDPSIQAPESSLNQDSLKTDIERSFAALSVREATILSMYYGLNGYSSMSLEEIGTKLGLTSERVRQVKTKAIRKLKEVKNNKRLKTYL